MSQGIASILSTASDTARLRMQAGTGTEQVNDEVIQQFEALFLQQMLKSMRTASLAEGLFQSDQSDFYRDMYDQQIASDLASKELLGVAQIINRQLGNSNLAEEGSDEQHKQSLQSLSLNQQLLDNHKANTEASSELADLSQIELSRLDTFIENLSKSVVEKSNHQIQPAENIRPLAFKPQSPNEFVDVATRFAQQPAEKLGVDPQVLVAIAALETGWGNHVPHGESGSSNNYFGIKADSRWDGNQVGSKTLEFEQGTFKQIEQSFRVYETLKESFNDYAEFLLSNDRYSHALEFAHDTKRFLQEIQNAGYATDPDYADKILNVLTNSAFSLSR